MAEMWHYTRSGQAQSPVELGELQQMAATGQLVKGDLVWTAGMPQWQPAGEMPQFTFPANGSSSAAIMPVENEPVPSLLQSESPDDDSPRRRRRERNERTRTSNEKKKSGAGTAALITSIIVGSVILVCGGIVFAILAFFRAAGDNLFPEMHEREVAGVVELKAGETKEFSINLEDGESEVRRFLFKKNCRYDLTVVSQFQTDVDLHVETEKRGQVAMDIAPDKDCQLNLTNLAEGTYIVHVDNLGPGRNRCTLKVICSEQKIEAIGGRDVEDGIERKSGVKFVRQPLRPDDELVVRRALKAGEKLRLRVQSTEVGGEKKAEGLGLHLIIEDDITGQEIVADRTGAASPQVDVAVDKESVIRIRVKNAADRPSPTFSLLY